MRQARLTVSMAVLMLMATVCRAQGDKPGDRPLTRQLMFGAVYVKEDVDRAWQLRIVGHLPRGPGLHAIVYNEVGDFVMRSDIPWGRYTVDKPFVVDVPADGKAQQYVVKMLGQQDNFTNLALPLTDLPLEVYGDRYYAFGHGTSNKQRRIVAFKPNADGKPIHFMGWSGHYRILDAAGNTVADSKDLLLPVGDPRKKANPNYYEMIVTFEPGRTYWIDPYGVMYVRLRDANLYLTFDPDRWFEPNLTWTLKSRPWWKGIVDVD